MVNNPNQLAATPMFAFASIFTAAVSILSGVAVAQMRGCNPWVGCIFEGMLVGVGFALLGLIFGIISWRKAESKKLAVIGMLLNLIPLLFVLLFLVKIITK